MEGGRDLELMSARVGIHLVERAVFLRAAVRRGLRDTPDPTDSRCLRERMVTLLQHKDAVFCLSRQGAETGGSAGQSQPFTAK